MAEALRFEVSKVLLSELHVLQVLEDLFQPCEQQVAAVGGQSPYEQIEGGGLEFLVIEVTCAHS